MNLQNGSQSQRPRVAICFYGLPRALPNTHASILEKLVTPLREHADVTCLAHLFETSAEPGEFVDHDVRALLQLDDLVLEPPNACLDRWSFERIRSYGDFWDNDGVSLRNLVHQLHSLHQVAEMALAAGVERCLFARPDLRYHDSMQPVAEQLIASASGQVFLPGWQRWKGGLNDRFAFCSGPSAIRALAQRANLMLDFCDRTGRPLQAEQLVAYALWRHGIGWSDLPIRASRVRANGAQVEEDFSIHSVRWTRQKLRLRAQWLRRGIWPGRISA